VKKVERVGKKNIRTKKGKKPRNKQTTPAHARTPGPMVNSKLLRVIITGREGEGELGREGERRG
jgi:hypothetical protein